MAFTSQNEQQLKNAREEAKKGTAGAKEAIARLEKAKANKESKELSARPEKTTSSGRIKDSIKGGIAGITSELASGVRDIYESNKADRQAKLLAEQQATMLAEQQAAQQRLVEANRRGNIEALRGAEKQALGATERQRVKTGEEAFGQRRGIKTEAKQAGRNLEQYMASRGLGRSGAAIGGTIAQDVTLQEGLAQARGQETSRLADIGQRETDIRTQTASGIAQAGQQAEAQKAQLAIAQMQQEAQQMQQMQQLQAQRTFEEQQYQRNQADALASEQRQREFEKAQAEIDFAIEEARTARDWAREDQLLEMKQQNALTLKQTPTGGRGGSGGGGLTYAQTRQQFNDQVDSYEQGLDSIIARAEATGEDANALILRYMRDLQSQNVDPDVIAELGQRKGAGSINPPRMSLGGIRVR